MNPAPISPVHVSRRMVERTYREKSWFACPVEGCHRVEKVEVSDDNFRESFLRHRCPVCGNFHRVRPIREATGDHVCDDCRDSRKTSSGPPVDGRTREGNLASRGFRVKKFLALGMAPGEARDAADQESRREYQRRRYATAQGREAIKRARRESYARKVGKVKTASSAR